MPNEFGSREGMWDAMAAKYDRVTAPLERRLLGPSRPWVAERAHGRVLEIGIGTGANLRHYRPGTELVGTDVSAAMIELARARADELELAVDLQVVDATRLPFADASFDTVTSTYVTCCVPDDRVVLAEALRVLRPGGRIVMANHVPSRVAPVRWLQRGLDVYTVPRQGEHFSRRPRRVLTGLGARIIEAEYSALGIIERLSAERPD